MCKDTVRHAPQTPQALPKKPGKNENQAKQGTAWTRDPLPQQSEQSAVRRPAWRDGDHHKICPAAGTRAGPEQAEIANKVKIDEQTKDKLFDRATAWKSLDQALALDASHCDSDHDRDHDRRESATVPPRRLYSPATWRPPTLYLHPTSWWQLMQDALTGRNESNWKTFHKIL